MRMFHGPPILAATATIGRNTACPAPECCTVASHTSFKCGTMPRLRCGEESVPRGLALQFGSVRNQRENIFVWDVISSECVLDIRRQSQEIWFKEFAMECMKVELSQHDRRVVVDDVQEWSQYLNEVIIDRSQVGIGCVGRKLEKLNLLQMFALWMDWDIMFSELL